MLMLGLMIGFTSAGAKLKKVAIILGARALFSIAFCMLTLAFLPFDFMTKLVVCILLWAPASAMGLPSRYGAAAMKSLPDFQTASRLWRLS